LTEKRLSGIKLLNTFENFPDKADSFARRVEKRRVFREDGRAAEGNTLVGSVFYFDRLAGHQCIVACSGESKDFHGKYRVLE
jgi:hypothetical protein